MLVATFGPTTTWVGKTVTYADGAFVLEGHGPIGAQDVFEYERQGHLVWSMDGIRAWVGARAQAEGGPAATPSRTAEWRSERPAAAGAVAPSPAEERADEASPADAKSVEEVTVAAATSGDVFGGLGAADPTRAMAIEEAARRHDWERLAALYALQAWWLDEEGRDALQVTRLARRAELRALAERSVALVRATAADDDTCAACRRVGGRVMTVADALRLMPIPNASCAYRWCRCRWEPADAPR